MQVKLGKCDFCSSNNPKWEFPCLSFQMQSSVAPIHAHMYDQWAACPQCATFIHEGNDTALAWQIILRNPLIFPPASTNEAIFYRLAAVMELHDKFRQSRLLGPPVYLR